MPQSYDPEVSSPHGRIDLAETLQLCAVVVAFHPLKRMHKSIQISLSQLTVLLPCHGAGVGCQRWRCEIYSDQVRPDLWREILRNPVDEP